MASFAESFTLSQDSVFRGNVHVAMVKVSTVIAGESNVGKKTSKWRKRVGLAVQILNDPDAFLQRFVMATVSKTSITGTPDSEIEDRISAIFDDMAGVHFEEKTS